MGSEDTKYIFFQACNLMRVQQSQSELPTISHEWLSHEIDASLEEIEMGGRIRKEGGWGVGEPMVSKAT